jgi:serine/threonine-protein kinase PRP4
VRLVCLCINFQGRRTEHQSSDREPSIHMEESAGKKGRNSKILAEDKSEDELFTNSKFDKEDGACHWSRIGTKINSGAGSPRNSSVVPQDELNSRFSSEAHVNGDLGRESRKEDKKRESQSPSKGSSRQKSYYEDEKRGVDGSKLSHQSKSSSQSTGDRGEFHARSRSRSIDHARERSRSLSIREEATHLKKRQYYDNADSSHADKSKSHYDSDDERIDRKSMNGQHGSRDLVRDEEREITTSYSRYIGEDRHRSRGTQERERSRDREMDRDLRREKEREWIIRDREMDRAHRREKEWERSRDRNRKSEIERDRSREREADRDWRREKERDKMKDIELDRDRSRVSERGRDRDREREKVRRERERQDDRSRNKDRETYENRVDGYENGDRYKHSRHLRHDEKEYNQYRTRNADSAKTPSSKSDLLEENRDKLKRYFYFVSKAALLVYLPPTPALFLMVQVLLPLPSHIDAYFFSIFLDAEMKMNKGTTKGIHCSLLSRKKKISTESRRRVEGEGKKF